MEIEKNENFLWLGDCFLKNWLYFLLKILCNIPESVFVYKLDELV